jgi:hypothetical protein
LNDESPVGKENLNLRRKAQNWIFIEGLIEFIEGLIARKIDF